MKICFLLNPDKTIAQNYIIVKNLANELQKLGEEVCFVYPSFSHLDLKKIIENNKYSFFYFNPDRYVNNYLVDLKKFKKKPFELIRLLMSHPIYTFVYIYRRLKSGKLQSENLSMKIADKFDDYNRLNSFDVVVGVSNPTYSSVALTYIKSKVVKIWYQIDPFALNGMIDSEYKDQLINSEKNIYQAVDSIVMQPLAYQELMNSLTLSEYADKCIPMHFPLMTKKALSREYPVEHQFESGKINCVYAGAVALAIRNPKYMLELFNLLATDNYCLHIWSRDDYSLNLKSNIEYGASNVYFHDGVDYERMMEIIPQADVLINLGNSISNQLPSKLLDYISFGLPIINIYKTDDCPARELVKHYALGINISESESLSESASKIKQFINYNLHKKLEWNIIEKQFSIYTPKSIAWDWELIMKADIKSKFHVESNTEGNPILNNCRRSDGEKNE
ncbi:MAG: hypothetical protein VB012_01590 [Erysipelotrichaceae bacterium]|nr:hypothetical protein [Erysipelotrichaceae bacterium]